MDHLLAEYLPIIVFFGVAAALGLAFILAALVLAVRKPDPEKVSAYECGFNAFDDARMKFDVKFYLVSILFIIFDLESRSCSPGRRPSAMSGWSASGR
jgi:NADH-quinone oxidoreductase subunit A